ncbi:hypothetical protein [Streptomyces sp. NPDC050988]|uniref:hypothetical protein n=1 Tax=Streptomyces sp. NPDC050988 TaxID=3365637 RepID=UPI0037B5BFBC
MATDSGTGRGSPFFEGGGGTEAALKSYAQPRFDVAVNRVQVATALFSPVIHCAAVSPSWLVRVRVPGGADAGEPSASIVAQTMALRGSRGRTLIMSARGRQAA